jgi:hypothetical protein
MDQVVLVRGQLKMRFRILTQSCPNDIICGEFQNEKEKKWMIQRELKFAECD